MSTRHDLFDPACPFCQICAGLAPATIVNRWNDDGRGFDILAIVPLKPVTPGHVLIIPYSHIYDVADDPRTFAEVSDCAGSWVLTEGIESANVITSQGAAATQSIRHLHVHVVPRTMGDGLMLPWGGNS